MRKVVFTKLGMENFCNHIELIEIEFNLGSLTSIVGPNGSGKTALLQALPYTLYGICEKGRGEDVLNDKTGKNCHTWVEFIINNDDRYRVDRYVKYTKVGTTVTIVKNNDDFPYKTGHKETVPEIEKLLLTSKLFANTLLFGQKVKSFFTDLEDSKQKDIFRQILKLGNFVIYQQEVSKQLKDVELIIVDINNNIFIQMGIVEDTKIEIKRIEKEKKEFYILRKKDIDELTHQHILNKDNFEKKEQELKKYEVLNLSHELECVNKDLGSVSQQIETLQDRLQTEVDAINVQKQLKNTEIVQSSNKVKQDITDNLQVTKSEIDQQYTTIILELDDKVSDIDQQLNQIDIQIATLGGDIKALDTKKDGLYIDPNLVICPTCHQDINENVILKLKNQVIEIETNIFEIQKQINQVLNNKEEFIKKKKHLFINKVNINTQKDKELDLIDQEIEKKHDVVQERFEVTVEKLNSLAKQQIIQCSIKNKKEGADLTKKNTILENTKSSLVKKIEERDEFIEKVQELKVIITNTQDTIENKKKEEYNNSILVSLQIKEKGSKIKIKELNNSRKLYNKQVTMLEFWKIGFSTSGIQSMLIDESIPFMNMKIDEYMDKLSNGRYSVSFDTLKATKAGEFRDKISVSVFDNHTHADKRIKLSGGQKRLVDIGTILTLCDLQSMVQDVEFNLLLFDEIFDALDDENIGYVANLMKQVSKNKWIGIISHKHIDQIEADDVLNFQ